MFVSHIHEHAGPGGTSQNKSEGERASERHLVARQPPSPLGHLLVHGLHLHGARDGKVQHLLHQCFLFELFPRAGATAMVRVRAEIMGSQKCGIVGKSQSVLLVINPIIFTCTRMITTDRHA